MRVPAPGIFLILCLLSSTTYADDDKTAEKTPVTSLAEAVRWLENEAHRIIRASAVPMKDGVTAFPPQVGIGYDAFWLRDYEYALEGSSQSLTGKELTDACRVFIRAMREDGAGVDCVKFDGTPIYKPGYGTMGREPVLDGAPFTVGVAWHTYHRTQDKALLQDVIAPLVKAMDYMPRNPANGLAHIRVPGERCPYGFTDTIPKSGDELFCSLLIVQASRQLGDLLEACGRAEEAASWRGNADKVSASVRSVFWDGQLGLFRATTGNCNVPDIWGSAFAVRLNVATEEQSLRIAKYFKEHLDELVLHGQVRHTPGFTDWDGKKTETNSGQYQSGGFWATPTGWFVFALDLEDPALADRTVIEMVRHFQDHGACEWINREGKCQLPGYTASAALPLEGIRAMRDRRASKAERTTARSGGAPVERLTPSVDSKACYLMTSHGEPETTGLRLALSTDGYRWTALNRDRSVMAPQVGVGKVFRDPSIARDSGGAFHIVWTVGWDAQASKGIGYVSSRDLIHFDRQRLIPVMENEPKTINVWAPELFWDEIQQQWMIFWASTVEGKFPETLHVFDGRMNSRIYYVTTKDFQRFGPSRLLFGPREMMGIDAFILHPAPEKYCMFFKGDRAEAPKRGLFVATASNAEGPYTLNPQILSAESQGWIEGPAAIRIKDEYLLYYGMENSCGAYRSKDLGRWEDCTSQMVHLPGYRHGTVIEIPGALAQRLIEHYGVWRGASS